MKFMLQKAQKLELFTIFGGPQRLVNNWHQVPNSIWIRGPMTDKEK